MAAKNHTQNFSPAHSSKKSEQQFVKELQKQAKIQSKLEKSRILPRQADSLASLIARYPWQTLVILSLLTTIILELFF